MQLVNQVDLSLTSVWIYWGIKLIGARCGLIVMVPLSVKSFPPLSD